jgi:antitoxin component of MazEF toxin-antitoxin module
MLKLSELHARHQRLNLSLVFRGFKTPDTRLWLVLPPPVINALQWQAGQQLRCKVSNAALVLTPLRQASAQRRVPPRKRTSAEQLRQDLAWQACLKGMRRSAKTKALVKRQQPGSVPGPAQKLTQEPVHCEPATEPMPINTDHSPLPTETVKADEQDASTRAGGEVPVVKSRWWIERLGIVFVMLLVLMIVLGIFVPMTLHAYRHVFREEPAPEATVVQNAGRVVSVSLGGGCFTRALVETDLGYYALVEAVSLNKHEALTLETRGDKARFLCDSQHHRVRLMPNDPAE